MNSSNGSCLVCNDGYYLDSTQKCVEVTTEIENCQSYSSSTSCIQCVSGYVISSNTCVEVVNKIDGCQNYASSTSSTCLQCEDNYVLSIDGSACAFNPSIRHCSNFSYIECLNCSSGFILHLNSYLDDFRTSISANSATLLNSSLYTFLRGSIDQIISTTCLNTQDTNCFEFSSIGVCASCNSGYYLNSSNECVLNPIEPIENCQFYSSLITCAVCDDGYHLDADFTCAQNTTIENCLTFDPSAFSTTCSECSSEYYLSNNVCNLRTNSAIENCTVYSLTEDKCSSCSSTLLTTSDGLKCLPAIENCDSYEESNSGNDVLVCATCQQKYYLSGENNSCVSGTVTNCLIYQTSADVCQTCNDGFYLSESSCVSRSFTIDNCLTYSPTVDDVCSACNDTSILFDINSSCKAIESITNCATYEQYNVCAACISGFYLDDNVCVQIPAEENCLSKTLDECTTCQSGYYLQDGLCYLIPELATSNCATSETTSDSPNSCLGCSKNYVPLQHTNQYLCRNPANVTGTLISNCIKYISDNGVLKCTRCQSTHIVSSDSLSCVLTCAANETVLIGDISYDEVDVYSNVRVDSYKKCYNIENDDHLEGCAMAAIALNSPGNKKTCVKCSDTYIPIQSCPVEIAYFNSANINNVNIGSSYVALECTQNANAKYAPGSSSSVPSNCSYFITDGNDNYYCKRCSFGFTSTVQTENDISFVTCTESVVGCDSTVRYGGTLTNAEWMEEMFGFNISHAYSCHKCSADTQIPFLHLSYQNELMAYALDTDTPSLSATPTEHHITCREPTAAGLQMSESQFTSFPANCALGIYVVDKTKRSDTQLGSSALCLACKNGFKPTYDESEYIITGCEAISNCDTSVTTDGWFNSCMTCQTGYAFQYDLTQYSLDTTTCVATTKTNCFALDSQTTDCAICNKNYVLNYDGVCESLKPDSCTNYVQLLHKRFNSANTYNNLGLAYYYLMDEGCVGCNNDYIMIDEQTTYETCNLSSYIQTGTFPATTVYISNCDSYYLAEGSLYCYSCAAGYIPNDINTKCTISTGLTNCAVTNTAGTTCNICNSTTTLVGLSCVSRSIANCNTYSEGSAALTCVACRDGYVLTNNSCVIGTITNCSVYDQSSGRCTNCNSGYVLVTSSSASQQCMAIPSSLNCATAQLAADNQELVCDTCASGFSFTFNTDDFTENTCVSINVVSNCINYDVADNLNDSTFKCTECSSSYYLSDSVCLSRTVTDGCKTFDLTADKCTACNNNFYLDSSGKCIAFVVGIKGCKKYIDISTCAECSSGYYLSDNSCAKVPTENLITQCVSYSDATTCSTCDDGYVLTSNTCEEAIAQNCATYTDVNNCSTCPTGYYLSIDSTSQVTSCIKGDISNCAEIRPIEPLFCIQCSGAFVLDGSGGCKAVSSTISNCNTYDNDTELCAACDTGFILSADKTTCIAFARSGAYSECDSLRYVDTPVCTVCNPGYYFDETICVKCASQNYETGCLYCDYSDQETCLICRSGFYQDTDGNCVLNSSLITAFENEAEYVARFTAAIVSILGLLVFNM